MSAAGSPGLDRRDHLRHLGRVRAQRGRGGLARRSRRRSEICARSGTDVTAPLPVTTIECWAAAAVEAPPAPTAPATRSERRRYPIATSNSSSRLLYAAERTSVTRDVSAGFQRGAAASTRSAGRYRFQVVGQLRRRGEQDEQHRRGRPRRAPHRHRRLLGEAVALAQVARRAGGDDVLPDRVAAAAARHDVVERQPAAARPAVDAAPSRPGRTAPVARSFAAPRAARGRTGTSRITCGRANVSVAEWSGISCSSRTSAFPLNTSTCARRTEQTFSGS